MLTFETIWVKLTHIGSFNPIWVLIKNREQHHENGAFDNGASAGPVQHQRIPTPGSASGEKPSEIELEDLSANSPSSSA
jgi:hypothetical protein